MKGVALTCLDPSGRELEGQVATTRWLCRGLFHHPRYDSGKWTGSIWMGQAANRILPPNDRRTHDTQIVSWLPAYPHKRKPSLRRDAARASVTNLNSTSASGTSARWRFTVTKKIRSVDCSRCTCDTRRTHDTQVMSWLPLLGRPVTVVVVILRQIGRASVHDAN